MNGVSSIVNKSVPVIVVFDVGKTNKKVFLFDEQYRIVHEQTARFTEITDEDGDACEDVHALSKWITDALNQLIPSDKYSIRAINFSSYGASFVHINDKGDVEFCLYNYLKPFPAALKKRFFDTYGGEKKISKETASPVLDHLNSGLQLYRLKYEKKLNERPGVSLHLPQYLSFLVTGKRYSDITSIGCHTMLWDFERNDYHKWVSAEGLTDRLAPIFSSSEVLQSRFNHISTGVGLHDSSSALIPYLASFKEPFILLSTGTWSISMNPFNNSALTDYELEHDCLCYLTYEGKPVKSSRLFAGHDHDVAVKTLASHFDKNEYYYQNVSFNAETIRELKKKQTSAERLDEFKNYEEAYHRLMMDIIGRQVFSTNLVMSEGVQKVFVDGGFSKNEIYLQLLANAYPAVQVYSSFVAQATALGAALAIHKRWNTHEIPENLIELKFIQPSAIG